MINVVKATHYINIKSLTLNQYRALTAVLLKSPSMQNIPLHTLTFSIYLQDAEQYYQLNTLNAMIKQDGTKLFLICYIMLKKLISLF